jgi:hypothetical protein
LWLTDHEAGLPMMPDDDNRVAGLKTTLHKRQSVTGHCSYFNVGKVQRRPKEKTAGANAGQWHAN